MCVMQITKQPPTSWCSHGRFVNLHKLKSMAAIVGGASLSFVGVATMCGQADFYSHFLMPAVHTVLDPERAHLLGVQVARLQLLRPQREPDPDVLFSNPIGLAAGFDKHAEGVPGAHDWGFGFVEVGSVTPLPQPGNPRPRVFRLTEDLAVVNRYGFNSVGHEQVWSSLHSSRAAWRGPVGVNLGRNKESSNAAADYVAGVHRFADLADYLVVNVSSPNTPGLRTLQGRHHLENLLRKVLEARDSLPRRLPVLVKIAPDLSDEEKADIAAAVTNTKVDGLVVCNTTVSRPSSLRSEHRAQPGGLSGRPLRDLSTQTIADLYRLTKGSIPIVGVGGVFSGEDAYAKIRAGASAVQLYSALIYNGPPVVRTVKTQLAELLRQDGYIRVQDAVGADHKK
ncbi:dihydroorotate dehydrogenase (quinone), mitochondrial isoform X2 [Dermacentor albipictus]|uniref:dihydroorotate dehydrogenase (quinone), mitochondrial isoform X2 n=1 Tax=Dermacentor albipictus TaxID=60249 RepID=UPI0031FBFAAC